MDDDMKERLQQHPPQEQVLEASDDTQAKLELTSVEKPDSAESKDDKRKKVLGFDHFPETTSAPVMALESENPKKNGEPHQKDRPKTPQSEIETRVEE